MANWEEVVRDIMVKDQSVYDLECQQLAKVTSDLIRILESLVTVLNRYLGSFQVRKFERGGTLMCGGEDWFVVRVVNSKTVEFEEVLNETTPVTTFHYPETISLVSSVERAITLHLDIVRSRALGDLRRNLKETLSKEMTHES